MWGTIVWLIEYKRGAQTDHRVLHRSGTNEESLKKGLLESAVRKGWKIIKIEEIINTFRFGGKNG